jgi:hypothetical protein
MQLGGAQGALRGEIFEAPTPPELPFVLSPLYVYPTGVSTFKVDNQGGNLGAYFLLEIPKLVTLRLFLSYPEGPPPPPRK